MASHIRILLLSLSLYFGGNKIVFGAIYEPANITFTITHTYVQYTAIATIILNDNIIMSATIYTPSNHTVRASRIYLPKNKECTNFIESSFINDRRVRYYCDNAPLGSSLIRRLIVTIDVPDETTVGGTWKLFVNDELKHTYDVPFFGRPDVAPDVVMQKTNNDSVRFSCNHTRDAVLSVWGKDIREHHSVWYQPECFQPGGHKTGKSCHSYSLLLNSDSNIHPLNYGTQTIILGTDLFHPSRTMEDKGIKIKNTRLLIEIPSYVDHVYLENYDVLHALSRNEFSTQHERPLHVLPKPELVKEFYKKFVEKMTMFSNVVAKRSNGGELQCADGEILYVANEFCVKESFEIYMEFNGVKTLEEIQRQRNEKCHFTVRESHVARNMKKHDCFLPIYYCFQGKVKNPNSIKLVQSSKKNNNSLTFKSHSSGLIISSNTCAPTYRQLLFNTPKFTRQELEDFSDISSWPMLKPHPCPCQSSLDEDGKLKYEMGELFSLINKEPQLEFSCTLKGVVGKPMRVADFSYEQICNRLTEEEKLNITANLPVPYMRVEINTDESNVSLVCDGIPKYCMVRPGYINGRGEMDDDGQMFSKVRLNEDVTGNVSCGYNDRVFVNLPRNSIPQVNLCGLTAFTLSTVESNKIELLYQPECTPDLVKVGGMSCVLDGHLTTIENVNESKGVRVNSEDDEETDGDYCLFEPGKVSLIRAASFQRTFNGNFTILVRIGNREHSIYTISSKNTYCVSPPPVYSPVTIVEKDYIKCKSPFALNFCDNTLHLYVTGPYLRGVPIPIKYGERKPKSNYISVSCVANPLQRNKLYYNIINEMSSIAMPVTNLHLEKDYIHTPSVEQKTIILYAFLLIAIIILVMVKTVALLLCFITIKRRRN